MRKLNKAQVEFASWMDVQSRFCVLASDDNDINLHFDYIADVGLVDVKDEKKIYRTDTDPAHDRFLVEWQAVYCKKTGERNRTGWVRGKADWIVFKDGDGWLWIRRTELLVLVEGVDWPAFSARGNYSENYKSFRRYTYEDGFDDRDDLFCYVPRADILKLTSTHREV